MATPTLVQDARSAAPPTLEASSRRIGERVIVGWLFLCAAVAVLITIGIVGALVPPTIEFFRRVPFGEFFSAGEWSPTFADPQFGVLRIVVGTLVVTFYAVIVALPFGLGAAIYMNEYASPRVRSVLKPTLEVLAGIPTVAFGFFAVAFVTPWFKSIWPEWLPGQLGVEPGVFAVGTAGLVLGIMIIPTVASVSQDAMAAVPYGLREAAYGIGSTRMQVATKIVVPAALSGIVASFVLGVSRAIGETMIVLLAAGATANLTAYPNESVLTMTSFIAITANGDIARGSTSFYTIFAVGSLLFVMTMVMNLISIRLVRKYREVYE